jgi:hypothetical protein
MANPLDTKLDTDHSFDSLDLDIKGGRLFASISTPQGQVEKPMLEVILHETGNREISNGEAKILIETLMWQKQLRGLNISAKDFVAIHEAQIISHEDLMDLANKFLEDGESKLYEDQLAAIGIARKSLNTMVLDISQLKFPVAPQVAKTRSLFSTRALAIAGAVLAIGGATAAGIMSMNRTPEGKQAAPVQPQIKPTTTQSKPPSEAKPAPAAIEEATLEAKPAPAPTPAPKVESPQAPEAEAPSCLTLPLVNMGNGRGGLIVNEAATIDAWKTLGYSVAPNTDTEGKKVYSLKDGQGNEFIVKALAANKGKTSIVADKKE